MTTQLLMRIEALLASYCLGGVQGLGYTAATIACLDLFLALRL